MEKLKLLLNPKVLSSVPAPKGKLYLHVGLPKTATTTLQYEVLSAPGNSGIYLGKYQGDPGLFQQALSRYLDGTYAFDEARTLLVELIGDRQQSVYSNEMLMVDSGVSWRIKLKKLGQLLENFDIVVIVTLRRPSQLGPSLYAELKPTAGWPDFDAFLKDPQSDVLNPRAVDTALRDAGLSLRNPVCYVDFDTLVASDFSVIQQIIPNIYVPDRTAQRNTRERRGNVIVSRKIGIYDLAYSVSRKLRIFNLASPRMRKLVGSALRAVPLNWNQNIEVPNTHPALDELDRNYINALDELNLITVD